MWHASVPAAWNGAAVAELQSEGDPNMGRTTRRRRVEPTDDWEQLALLCRRPEQRAHEEIRPLTLFGSPVAERASETGTPERMLYRRVGCFEEEGVEGLFGSEHARRKRFPPAIRRNIVDLKAEYPASAWARSRRSACVRVRDRYLAPS